MDDSRLIEAKKCLEAAMLELSADTPNTNRIGALLDDGRTAIVEVVDGGISTGASRADMSQLESARLFINRALGLLAKEWAFTSAQECIGHALDYLQVVLSGNVIPISRRRTHTSGGGAA